MSVADLLVPNPYPLNLDNISVNNLTVNGTETFTSPSGGVAFNQTDLTRNTSQTFRNWYFSQPPAQTFTGPWAAPVANVSWSVERIGNMAFISVAGMTPPALNNGAAPAAIVGTVTVPDFVHTAPLTSRSGLLKVLSGGVYQTGSWYYDSGAHQIVIRPTEDPTSLFPVGSTGLSGWTESFSIYWMV